MAEQEGGGGVEEPCSSGEGIVGGVRQREKGSGVGCRAGGGLTCSSGEGIVGGARQSLLHIRVHQRFRANHDLQAMSKPLQPYTKLCCA